MEVHIFTMRLQKQAREQLQAAHGKSAWLQLQADEEEPSETTRTIDEASNLG
jgi:hypothetical protein